MTVLSDIVSFLMISDAPRSTAEIIQNVGEFVLLVSSVVVVVGLIGETQSEKWSPAPPRVKLWHRAFVLMVTLGVAGELISDGAIFSAGHRLGVIADDRVAILGSENLMLARIMLPRRLPLIALLSKNSQKICSPMTAFKGTQIILQALPEREPVNFASDFLPLASAFGWKPPQFVAKGLILFPPEQIPEGVGVWASPSSQTSLKPNSPRIDNSVEIGAAKALADCINGLLGPGSAYGGAGWELNPPDMPMGDMQPSPAVQPTGVIVLVGANPVAQRIGETERAIMAKH